MVFSQIVKLAAEDSVETFDCGHPALNQFLQRYALINQKANSTQTYVSCINGVVAGFYSLAVGSVDPANAPSRVVKGLSRHPVPVMILARLAIDRVHQRKGLGQALLRDALLRTAQAADIAGVRALLVHAKDEAARQWYMSWEFEPSPTDHFHLFLMLKDLKALLGVK
ncbi:MAG: GNAT family N-acetyltransferase [Proteobacteria bacterium]|nr:GNAT family N-acetyltransferase [Pseudomonadota bacterium]